MRVRHPLTLSLLAAVLAVAPASASMGNAPGSGGSDREPPVTVVDASKTQPDPHEQAEAAYSQAYEEVARAKAALADGKPKDAQKSFKRALEYAEKATALDDKYHEAWNLVGFAARKLGDYDKAFAAYDKCLEIKSDYAPAREYLGEAWLEKGDAAKAREQLALLKQYGAKDEAATLEKAITDYEAAHAEKVPDGK